MRVIRFETFNPNEEGLADLRTWPVYIRADPVISVTDRLDLRGTFINLPTIGVNVTDDIQTVVKKLWPGLED